MFPTIDLQPFLQAPFPHDKDFPSEEQLKIAHTVDECFRSVGLLFIHNVSITEEILHGLCRLSADLFSPPDNAKRDKLLPMHQGTNMGYLPFSIEGLNTQRGPDIKETYNFKFGEGIQQDFRGCPPGFRETASKFWDSMTATAYTLCTVCALALGLPDDYFRAAVRKNESSTIRLLHYPPCQMPTSNVNTISKGAIRAGEHTDFGLFTFLFTDGPGLQARESHGSEYDHSSDISNGWVDVPVPKGTDCIVVLGALMSRWTNDLWPAVVHRVVIQNETEAQEDRLTIACFFQPDADFTVEVHPKFVTDGSTAKYEPITARDYILHRLHQAKAGVPIARDQ